MACAPTCVRVWATWNWQGYSHCGGCHRTFATVADFDRHRSWRRCLDPAAVGLTQRKGVWSGSGKADLSELLVK